MHRIAVFLEELDLQPAHLEVVAGVCFVRFDDISQLAEADGSGQFFESGFFDAELEG